MANEESGAGREGVTLLVGAGNPSRRDDGVGIHVVRRLVAAGLPDGCEALELHGGWLDLVGRLHRVARLVVVDAADVGLAPGTLVEIDLTTRLDGGAAAPSGGHAIGLAEALAVAAATGLPVPGEVRALGIQPRDAASFGEELSADVEAALDGVCLAVRRALEGRESPRV